MYATLDSRPAHGLATEPGFAGAYALTRIGDDRVTTLALWHADPGTPDGYLVEHDLTGPTAGPGKEPGEGPGNGPGEGPGNGPGEGLGGGLGDGPTAASIAWFDGPFSPARLAAARLGFTARIAPALQAQPGVARALVLWRERDGSSCAVVLAADLPAIEATGRAVNATALLPQEDPALLTGPDRVDIHHVTTSLQGARS